MVSNLRIAFTSISSLQKTEIYSFRLQPYNVENPQIATSAFNLQTFQNYSV